METLRRTLLRPLDTRTVFFCITILMLNLADAFATLRHLEHGAEELNPFMVVLLRRGAQPFVIVKHLLASIGVIGIALHPERKSSHLALCVLVPLYALLVTYQMALFYLS
jgi:hypothetical protein